MIRSNKFLISNSPYAINLDTLTATLETCEGPRGEYLLLRGDVNAVWYRRKNGTTRACIGNLRLINNPGLTEVDVTDPVAVLSTDLDGRYGGDCKGRWDGTRYWGAQEPDMIEQHLALLRPMIDDCPSTPAGYDGWWRFR